MEQKKIVIISRTITPSNRPRAHRATELAKQFARLGHEVLLYANLGAYDYNNFEKTFGLKVHNIANMWFSILDSDDKRKKPVVGGLIRKLGHYLFEFPEIELMFRMPKILREEKDIDLLITVAVPHPLHWGVALAKFFNTTDFAKVWVADCGDPYMGNKMTSKKKPFYFKYLEKWFSREADFISIPFANAINGYYKEFHHKIKVIPQGYSFENMEELCTSPNNKIPTFAYTGTFYPLSRNPTLFLEFLTGLDLDFKFIIYTSNITLLKPFQDRLDSRMEIREYIPRNQLLEKLSCMDFLVNFENGNQVHLPSKLIDYSLSNRPILSLQSDYIDEDTFKDFLKGNYTKRLKIDDIDQYNITSVADKFLNLIR